MTYHPTSRVLTVLELLQAHPVIGGAELAARLEVDTRTVRRYIAMLQDMGIPVEATPGRHGGYTLRAGFKLPPLMFTDGEATALALGLLAARRLGLAEVAPAIEGALAKIERVLPNEVRARVQGLRDGLVVDLPPHEITVPGILIADLSQAARECRQVLLHYQGEHGTTERVIDPYGVVCHAGRWYAIGHCHLRQGLRIFRLDRIERARLEERGFDRPAGFDALAYLTQSIAEIPDRWDVTVILHTTIERARQAIPAGLAVLEQRPEGVWLRSSISELEILALVLASVGCELTVVSPPQLCDTLHMVAERLLRA
jgi:predicted DNA-binding transcriptional regulator YafY